MCGDLLAHLPFDLRCMLQYVFYGPVFMQQLERRLLADPGNARNIIGRIAHKSLQIDDLLRFQPILLVDMSRSNSSISLIPFLVNAI